LSCGRNHHFTGEVDSGRGLMGLKMSTYLKSDSFIQSILVFTGMPLLIWALGSLHERSLLKESISIMTILAFCQMIGLFFWSRGNRHAGLHKIVGYTCVTVLLFHPVLLVVPRFFASGVPPVDALATILTTFNQGVVLGMLAWCLMLIIGITSLARRKLPMKYTTWRVLHGILAMLFVSIAAWHVIDLGRHASLSMSILIIVMTAGGIQILLKNYTCKYFKK